MKPPTLFLLLLLTIEMSKAFVSMGLSALVGAFCGFSIIKLAAEVNNRNLSCYPPTIRAESTHPFFGTVLYCKAK
jgi:hypothetical protein